MWKWCLKGADFYWKWHRKNAWAILTCHQVISALNGPNDVGSLHFPLCLLLLLLSHKNSTGRNNRRMTNVIQQQQLSRGQDNKHAASSYHWAFHGFCSHHFNERAPLSLYFSLFLFSSSAIANARSSLYFAVSWQCNESYRFVKGVCIAWSLAKMLIYCW